MFAFQTMALLFIKLTSEPSKDIFVTVALPIETLIPVTEAGILTSWLPLACNVPFHKTVPAASLTWIAMHPLTSSSTSFLYQLVP